MKELEALNIAHYTHPFYINIHALQMLDKITTKIYLPQPPSFFYLEEKENS